MAVPLFDTATPLAAIDAEIRAKVSAILDKGAYVLGPEVRAFEQEFASYVGARHAIGVANGTDALILALRALGVGPGDEVVVPSFTFYASAEAIPHAGARPVFCDVDPETFLMTPEHVKAVLTPRTKAVIAVHLFGNVAPVEEIEALGVPVVEDAAQAAGTVLADGRRPGALGTIATFSFYPSKNLGAFGDGGAVTTNDDALAARLRMLRVHGERERYKHEAIGWNSRLDALQAAVLRVKLPHLDGWSAGRVANADRYDRLFAESGLVARECVQLPVRAPKCGHIFNQYTIRVRQRDALGAHLKEQGIGWGIYYPIPLHLQECFGHLGYEAGDMPEAERASNEVLSLPIFPELTASQLERVVSTIAAFY